MLRRSVPLIAPLLFVVLGAAGPFEGCDEGGTSDDPRPLPRDDGGACFFDEDCVAVGCEALRCLAGACVQVAPIRDADGDGHAPPPCGTDCDDRLVTVSPDATEVCDLVDQDCDGTIDEDAAPTAIRFDLTTLDPTMSATSWDDQVIVSDAEFTSRGLRTRRLSLDGTLGTVEPLFDTEREPIAIDAAPAEGGAWFVIALEPASVLDPATLVLVELERAEEGVVTAAGAPVTRDVESVTALVAITIDGVPYVAWDAEDTSRFVWTPAWAAPVRVADGLVAGIGALDLASDGTNVAVPSGTGEVTFLAATDGTVVGTVTPDGELSPGRPLASDEGHVWVLVRDAFDHSVQPITASGTSPVTTLPTGGGSVHLGIDRTPDGLVITRGDTSSVRAWVLDAAMPSMIRRTFGADEISGTGRAIVSVDVASTSQGTAIVTNFGAAGSSLAVLACGAGS
ncbi:putative metal-binding motif-containing protein [Sandaracinus amylolyticus]|uniref:putative metal-binding motif-containing protein n=1 Tax=Sandaracinus amylolyticus TaxID=927083 RepID=UPI001F397B3A|nr:putative metal-binding motif-containing protein [Sandaracinus amylolyticus]